MNVNTLHTPPPTEVTWLTSEAGEKEANFLSLRLLNKRMRIRISSLPIDLSVLDGNGNFLVVSLLKGWVVAITKGTLRENQLTLSPLSGLRNAIQNSTAEGEAEFKPGRVVPILRASPTHLALGSSDERLVVGHADGSISIYDTSNLFTEGENVVDPLYTLSPSSLGPLRQIVGNPGGLPDLVAVRRDAEGDGLAVEVLDVRSGRSVAGWRSGGTRETVPTAVSWSPKGKQIALGFQSGDIATYIPLETESPKQYIPKPPQAGDVTIISVIWLSNQVFYGIYIPSGDKSPEAPQKHILTVFDAKSSTATQTEFETPYYPSPALRPPGAFPVIIRNWNPTKYLIFISDSTSGDIGLVGSLSERETEAWCNFSLAETSTPSLPLDKDDNDTVPLALELDTTIVAGRSDNSSPILYLYASDGTLQAWSISNSEGGPYISSMVPQNAVTSPGSNAPEASMTSEKFASLTSSPSSTDNLQTGKVFGLATPSSAFGHGSTAFRTQSSPVFGQATAPGFATTAFGKQSLPGQPSSAQSLGHSSAFESQAFASSVTPAIAPGFGAFSNKGPAKFGTTGFGFGAPPSAAVDADKPASSPPLDSASPEAEMPDVVDEKTDSVFGQLSLGATNAIASNNLANGMFGTFANPIESNQGPTVSTEVDVPAGSSPKLRSSFGAFGNVAQGPGFIRPATGFGMFSGPDKPKETQPTAFSISNNVVPKTTPAFGSSGFGAATTGVPTFGKLVFGQTSFGGLEKPSFGAVSTALPSSSVPPASGGFSAFAGTSKGFSAFAQGSSSFFQPTASKTNETQGIDSHTEPKNSFTGPANHTASFTSATQQEFSSSETPNASAGSSQSSPFRPASAPSLATAPSTRMKTPESSPENSPVIGGEPLDRSSSSNQVKAVESEGNLDHGATNKAPSASLKLDVSAPSTGAFGNLTTTPSFFKPAEGFGAFGASSKVSSSSPFANPKPFGTGSFLSSVPTSGSGGTSSALAPSTSTKPNTEVPAFGSTSALGSTPTFGKSSFGSHNSVTLAATPTKSISNAFSSYSASGGFSAFAGAGKSSFSEILRAGKDGENTGTGSEKYATTESPSEDKPDGSKDVKLESSLTAVSKPDDIDHDNLPPTPSSHGTFDDEVTGGKDEEDDHDDSESFLSEDFSDKVQESEEGETGETGIKNKGTTERTGATTTNPPSEDLTSKPASSENTNEIKKLTIASFPLRASAYVDKSKIAPSVSDSRFSSDEYRSASDTAPPVSGQPFTLGNSGSLVTDNPSSISAPLSKTAVQSTTPPGSPLKDEPASFFAPRPVALPLTSASSLGIGRPNSRPTKSSPLAHAPASNEHANLSTDSVLRPRPASPKIPFGQLEGGANKAKSSLPIASRPSDGQLVSTSPEFVPSPARKQGTPPHSLFSPATPHPLLPSPSPTSREIFNGSSIISPNTVPPLSRPLFGGQPQSASPATAVATPASKTAIQLTPQPIVEAFESEMQSGCAQLCLMVQKELNDLSRVAKDADALRANFSRSASNSHSKTDFGDRSKWAMGDISAFTTLLRSCEEDIMLLYGFKAEIVPILREVESYLLKAETRKEEIIRFSRAKADPEFAKMLKFRTLGPDANETRDQLRRQIRLLNDRVEQLEAHLKACKKKTEEYRRGRTSMIPPSLDTINRTFRNIDRAVDYQLQRIVDLSDRVRSLDLKSLVSTSANGHSNARSPGAGTSNTTASSSSRFRPEVTQSVAASTAAALNAERSAMRLKLALARTSTAPLINKQATGISSGHVPNLSRKPNAQDDLNVTPCALPTTPDASPETSPTTQRQTYGRTNRHSAHAKAPQLGRTHQKVPSGIANFSFGPLPGAKPMESLPFDVRPGATRKTS